MSIKKYSDVEINVRLKELVEEISRGNASDFAKKSNIKVQTLHTYLRGRNPNAESIFNICVKFKINLNWLIAGVGEKYLTQENKAVECAFLETVDNWISDLKKDDPESEIWFKFEFKKMFPDFKAWLQRKNGAEGRDTSISKVA